LQFPEHSNLCVASSRDNSLRKKIPFRWSIFRQIGALEDKAMNTKADDIFNEALKLENHDARLGYVRGACQGNLELQNKIERLLAAHENASDLIATEPGREPFVQTVSEEAGTVIGRYKLLQKVGEGGMGAVFMAEQTEPVRRKVALKIIKLGMDTKSVVARFEAERQTLALMDHPNIAKVLDAGATDTGRPYFVMELVKGVPINTYCDKNHLPTRERLELFTQVCQSIQHAHQKGVIHRDIKPSNILVTLHDGKPVPKVIDFGIAKATNQRLTEKTLFTNFAQMIGTPAYMSPEQAEMSGLDVDTRTDVYSLGVLLYELLTGTTPFPEKELLSAGYGEMQRIIAEQERERPSLRISTLMGEQQSFVTKSRAGNLTLLTKQLTGDLDWIAMKALEKDRTRRYETANGLANDIQRHLTDEPVVARPPNLGYRFRKAWRRHKAVVSAGVGIAASLVLGLSLSLWKTIEASTAREEALANETRAKEAAANARRAEKQSNRLRVTSEKQAKHNRRLAYASDMNRAQQMIEWGNIGQAMNILTRYQPEAGEDDLRDWEWRYLRQQCRSDAAGVLTDMGNQVVNMRLSVSHDGRVLAARYWSEQNDRANQMVFFDLKSRKEFRPDWLNDEDHFLLFSPTESLAVVHRWDAGVSLIDTKTGNIVWNADVATRQDLQAWSHLNSKFSRNGDVLAVGTGYGTRIWRVADGKSLLDLPGQSFSRFLLSPDGTRYALFGRRNGLSVFDVATGRSVFEREMNVGGIAFSNDGTVLFGSRDLYGSEVVIVDAATGEELGSLKGHRSALTDLEQMPDGRTIVTTSVDQTIRLWDWKTQEQIRVLRGHREEVRDVLPLPDGKSLVSGSYDGQLLFWNLERLDREVSSFKVDLHPSWRPRLKGFPSPKQRQRRWTFSEDSKSIHTVRQQRLTRLSGNRFEMEQVLHDFGEDLGSYTLAEDHRHLASIYRMGDITLWDLADERAKDRWIASVPEIEAVENIEIPGVFVTKDRLLVAECRDGKNNLLIAKISDSKDVAQIALKEGELILSVSHDGRWALTTETRMSGLGRLLDLDAPHKPSVEIESPDSGGIFGAVLAPTRDLAVVSGEPHIARLYSLSSGRLLGQLRGQFSGAKGVFFSPDEQRLTTTSAGQDAIMLWDLETNRSVLTLGAEGLHWDRSQFSPDGSLLGTLSTTGMIHIWRAPSWDEIESWDAEGSTEISPPLTTAR
jgi:eukaryotic-like serine/threonine-protein kinase